MIELNPRETAPKDGTMFLADMGWPYLVACCWNGESKRWVYANPQIGLVGGIWNDPYFENEWEEEGSLKGWTPLPKHQTKKKP